MTRKHIWFWQFNRHRHEHGGRAWKVRLFFRRLPTYLHWAWLDVCDLVRPEVLDHADKATEHEARA